MPLQINLKRLVLFLFVACGVAAAGNGCMSGLVLDAEGNPIDQMQVRIHEVANRFSRTTHTTADGTFSFADLPADNYDLVTENDDLGYPDSNIFDFTGTTERKTIRVESSDLCALATIRREPRAGKIQLHLLDASNGKDIPNPDANFRRTEERHHAWNGISIHGNYLLVPSLVPIEIQVGAKGYENSDILKIPPMKPGEDRALAITLSPVALGCLTGTILSETHKPVPGIQVQPLLMNNHIDAKMPLFTDTDKQGKFEMRNLHPGTYRIFVEGRDLGYDSFSVLNAEGQYPEAEVPASASCAEITVKLVPQAKILVDVSDASTHQPIKNFKFYVKSVDREKNWSTESQTQESLVPPYRPCTIEAVAEGYQASAPVPLGSFEPREVRHLRIELQEKETPPAIGNTD